MTNTEIAAKLVIVRRGILSTAAGRPGKRVWFVYAPGQPGQRQMQGSFTSKKDAEKHAFHIAAHVAQILDAADRLRGPAEFNAGVEAARVECGSMMRDARQMKDYVAGNVLARLWSSLNHLRKGGA